MNLKVTDIKQFIYCPRIIYFTYVCPVPRKTTYKMDAGKDSHIVLDKLEKRRTLNRYNLEQGRRLFHTQLHSDRLGLEGKLDLHIDTGKELFPVEFKFTERSAGLNHKYQLISYAMLLEDCYNRDIRYGLLYLAPQQQVIPVDITANARQFVREILVKIRTIVQTERMPDGQRKSRKCHDCEYRRYCGDID